MSIRHGDLVRWNAVNGVTEGAIQDYMGNDEWLILLKNGRCIIVNQKSFIDDKGSKLA